MSFEDDEIVQDFLVEAGEILELLAEQLVELEQTPADSELLNAVFRGFHTIKGGASFISLTSLVEVCHIAEDVFNQLRQGERLVDSNLMDIMLQVLDVLNDMFVSVRAAQEPEPAPPSLIANLKALLTDKDVPPVVEQTKPVEPSLVEPPSVNQLAKDVLDSDGSTQNDEITDQEFESLLRVLDDDGPVLAVTTVDQSETSSLVARESDDITQEEFESLLDELHSKPHDKSKPLSNTTIIPPDTLADTATSENTEDISEAEFDKLLDQLHGEGKFSAPGNSAQIIAEPALADAITQTSSTTNQAAIVGNTTIAAASATPIIKPESDGSVSAEKQPEIKNDTTIKTTSPGNLAGNTQAETTVRVDTKRLDDIMNMVGELVLVRNRLVTIEATLGDEQISEVTANLDLVTADLQTAVMKTRMQPIKKVFGRFPRVVRDLARSLKKEVQLELKGEDTDLDKNLVEALADPLVHLVRNAVDHGIETPDVREQAGKERTGRVLLSAQQEGDHILLTIKDDGSGMDPDVLRRKAVEKGMMDEETASRLDDKEAFGLIFAPGFSTKDNISDISGRGVGMDVVKTRIIQLNGAIDIDSVLGSGTTLKIKVPLTLAIMPTLMVMLGEQIFALPLVSVSEIFNLDLTKTNKVDGQEVIMLREQALPLYFLKDWLVKNMLGQQHPKNGHVVVVSVGNQKAGFVVEQLIGQEEVVIKPLGKMLYGTQGLSGATITGDGRIALILDVPSLMQAYAGKY